MARLLPSVLISGALGVLVASAPGVAQARAIGCSHGTPAPQFTAAGQIGGTASMTCWNGDRDGVVSIAPEDRIGAMAAGVVLERFDTQTIRWVEVDHGVDSNVGPGTISVPLGHACNSTRATDWRIRWVEGIAEDRNRNLVYDTDLRDSQYVTATLNCG